MGPLGELIRDLCQASVAPDLIGRVADIVVFGPVTQPPGGAKSDEPVPYRPPELAGAKSMFDTVFNIDATQNEAEPAAVPRDEYGL